jgi:hypothetical protein
VLTGSTTAHTGAAQGPWEQFVPSGLLRPDTIPVTCTFQRAVSLCAQDGDRVILGCNVIFDQVSTPYELEIS